MILYLDTAALVKLVWNEPYSELVRDAYAESSVVTTHLITYAEACSAFAALSRARREPSLFVRLRRELDLKWPQWSIVAPDAPLVRRAGTLAARFHLRGYDSVHLAAVEAVHDVTRGTSFHFAVFDADLVKAARKLGIPTLTA